jgi:NADPH:quinone reductase
VDLGIKGRRAIVCASSKGLGRACAVALANEGVHVTLTARGAEALKKTADEIRKANPGVTVTEIVGDITTPAGREAVLKACPEPDILINNAGGPPPGDFRNWTRDDWIKAIDANMLTPIELIKATVDGMMARKFGRIVNITSAAVKAPIEVLGLSNGARAGLTGFVAGIARKTVINNVTINALLPGPFDTDRLRGTRQAQSGRAVRRSRGIRTGLRVPVRRQGRLHHRTEPPARRRRVSGHAMKAVWYERTGPAPEVLTCGEMPTPMAGPGEVRVRLEASGVNPADVGRRGGSYRAMEYPRVIPNSDGAGIIDQVGDGVTRLKAGQRVWLFNGQRNGRAFGTAAEYIALAEHLVTPLPDNLSFAEGATLGIPAMTAWTCLYCDGPIVGQTVLVTGGAGAVGHYAVQLAKWGGAKVIATVSSAAKGEQARLAGADLVINYRNEDVVAKAKAFTGQRGVDRVVDVDFGGNIETTLKLMGMNSTIAVYATNGNRTPVVPMRELMEKCIALRALVLFALPPPLLAAAQADISKWLSAGPRIHNVAAQFALSDTAQAHLAVEKGDKMGTVIVDCAR